MNKIAEVVVDCRIDRACLQLIGEAPQLQTHLAAPFVNGKREVLIDGKWQSIPEQCLIEIQKG